MGHRLQSDLIRLAIKTPELRKKVLESLSVLATPDFIPHEKWHTLSWLLPMSQAGEPWFYSALGEISRNREKKFSPHYLLKTVDPPLKELVFWLNKSGIETGPSCAGHDVSKKGFQSIWRNLQSEAERIRKVGLPLKDAENGDFYVMRDASYNLPWSSFEDFYNKAEDHQSKGWLPYKSEKWDALIGNHGSFDIIKLPSGWRSFQVLSGTHQTWGSIKNYLLNPP